MKKRIAGWRLYYRAVWLSLLALDCGALAAEAKTIAAPGLAACVIEGVADPLLCGTVMVFENRETGKGRQIALDVIVLPALEPGPSQVPLFDIEGGPGVAVTNNVVFYGGEGRAYRQNRDVVLVALRGTGKSNPLRCTGDDRPKPPPLSEMYPVAYVEQCRRALERSADLRHYTTRNAVADLDQVRAWLGYPKIDLQALSYGTRTAQVYLRSYPDRVRRLVMFGVLPMTDRLPISHARNGQRALALLFDDCAADTACNAAFPTLREEWHAVLERLQRPGVQLSIASTPSRPSVVVPLPVDVFAEAVRSWLYRPATTRQLPWIIHRAAQDDFQPFLALARPQDADDSFIPDGLYLSVTCAEGTREITPSAASLATRGTDFGDYRVVQQRRACALWPGGRAPKAFYRPVRSNLPTLILSGHLDPVTPPAWADAVAATLPNARHIVIPQSAHVGDGLSHFECWDDTVLSFLSGTDPGALNADCFDTMRPPPFKTAESDAH